MFSSRTVYVLKLLHLTAHDAAYLKLVMREKSGAGDGRSGFTARGHCRNRAGDI